MGPELVRQFRNLMGAIEDEQKLRVVVFESAVEGFFLNHSDFNADLDELTGMSQGPTGLGRGRALEVLLASEDIGGDLAQEYGYVNRALPDTELDAFVDGLARRIAGFDKWAISNTKRLVNAASLAPEVEIAAGWEACMTSIARPAAQARFKALRELGWHKPGDAENRLGFYLGQINR